ncbi:MAG: 1-(5-phosphoribosyl)-5-[(5-phosphoribosylamino)methylideneamino]imidazole-4-carboxamide isomerase [Bacteroidales bacterium]|nr:1-(5-phosphoribosyl)-5-[(5-phosphoribosylamino)methylideneamino]imidazole-4-carboxamide isomerase [Bacteroidales bacterium]
MRIIVAMDIINGKCVRLTRGDFSTSKIYNEDPLEVARKIEDHGISYLHIVDLDGAREKRLVNHKIMEKIASKTSLKIDFGGGIRTYEDLKCAFDYGAGQVTCGSVALKNSDLFLEWLREFGSEKVILGADCKGRKIATEGWMNESETDIIEFIDFYRKKGIVYTICTDIEKDGMLNGPSVDLYRELAAIEGIKLIASGGISSIDDIEELAATGCNGAIVGKALYEGIITLKELKRLC